MGFQLNRFCFGFFLLLTVSSCQAKNVTVTVVGLMHCTDCVRHKYSSSKSTLGVDVAICCKSRSKETKTQGNGAVDKEGKFKVTLSAEISEDGNSIDGCFAKLQTASSAAPCPIHSAQTASVELISNEENAAYNRPTIIKFSPVTCQSAFFWPQPNFTFFPTSPPPPEQRVEYGPPPSESLPPIASPVEPPLSPVEELIPPPAPASEPSYLPQVPSLPPAPESETPSPLPALNFGTPPPTPAPTFQSPQSSPSPTIKNPTPPPLPIYNIPPLPPLNKPIPPPIPKFQKPIPPSSPFPPKEHKKPFPKTPIFPPVPVLSPPPPFSEIPNPAAPPPKHEKPVPPPSPAGMSIPPSERKPNPIPRAPPVPQLPPIPHVPRKYFNSPKSKSKPPHSF